MPNVLTVGTRISKAVATGLLVLLCSATFIFAESDFKERMLDDKRLEGLVHAPEFPKDLEWLNTDRPLSLAALRGKVVLLDFWTFCCINCMHVLPDLAKLEEKYKNELVVIGVHSAKFDNEKGTESIRQAILRYNIHHPVVNDHDFEIWQNYAVQAWPTLVAINPNGRIIGVHSGEGAYEIFDSVIQQTIEHFDPQGKIDRTLLNLVLEKSQISDSELAFPGKIKADAVSQRLFIADSNHHRIIISETNGKVVDIIGSGQMGADDGAFEKAEFNHPQGIFPRGNLLYIADTENHLIRLADLKKRTVTTLFGTGKQSQSLQIEGMGRSVNLNSPWDLLEHQNFLYIAMAGSHQLCRADLKTLKITVHAGSGQEARVDGRLLEAALAQPSGITTDGQKLYFADSEVSSIRSADIDSNGKVETIIGENLFVFGDVDGSGKEARLQHALGIEYDRGVLYIADTYNSKIKVVDPNKKTSATFAGTGQHGKADGGCLRAEFFEPGGLTILNDILYVADTNNHLIRKIDLKTNDVSTLKFEGLSLPKEPKNEKKFRGRILDFPKQKVKQGSLKIILDVHLPEDHEFAEDAPFRLNWDSSDPNLLHFKEKSNDLEPNQIHFPFEISAQADLGNTELILDSSVYFCRKKSKLCFSDQFKLKVPLEIGGDGASEMTLPVDIPPKS